MCFIIFGLPLIMCHVLQLLLNFHEPMISNYRAKKNTLVVLDHHVVVLTVKNVTVFYIKV